MKPKNFKYTQEVLDFIQTEGIGHTNREIAQMLNERFPGFGATLLGVKNAVLTYKIDLKRPKYGHHGSPWPADVRAFMEANYKGTRTADLARMVNERFGPGTITVRGLRSWKKNNKVRSGAHLGRLKPGCMSHNKGKHWDDFLSPEAQQRVLKNLFPKGPVPANIAKIGEIRVNTDGYLVKKVQSFGNQQKRWRFLHRLVWEEHNGPIPKGCVISFADGNKQNCAIENLVLETKAQHAIKNHMGWKSWDQESAEAYNLLADVKSAVSRKKRGKGGKS